MLVSGHASLYILLIGTIKFLLYLIDVFRYHISNSQFLHVLIHNSLVLILYSHLFPLMPNPFVLSGMHTEKPRFIESGETQLFLGACKCLYRRLCWLVGPSVGPHITLSAFFSAVCGWINLKFGRDLHVNLLFQFLSFFSQLLL